MSKKAALGKKSPHEKDYNIRNSEIKASGAHTREDKNPVRVLLIIEIPDAPISLLKRGLPIYRQA